MYFCGIAQILPVRHETSINQSINQSTICPPNVVDFGRYPIHIEMQCIAVCHVERHQNYNTHDVIAQITMADEDS